MYIRASYWPSRPCFLEDGLVLCTYVFYSIFKIACLYTLQNYILLKDSRISPCICNKNDFGSKTTRTGVSLHGATSNRDSMWHSPVFTCISPNRIPVKRTNRTVVRNFKMEGCVPFHWFPPYIDLVKFIARWITSIKYLPTSENNLSDLSNITKKRKMTDRVKNMKFYYYILPKMCTMTKHS
jgi:hypothetical protein